MLILWMRKNKRFWGPLFLSWLLWSTGWVRVEAGTISTYQVVDLGPVIGNSLSDHGSVVGETRDGRAFLYRDGQRIDLGSGTGLKVNSLDQVLLSENRLWQQGATTNLDPQSFTAYDINNLGQVVGISYPSVVVLEGGQMTPVPGLENWLQFDNIAGLRLSDQGKVLVFSVNPGTDYTDYQIWSGGQLALNRSLIGHIYNFNESLDVAGFVFPPDYPNTIYGTTSQYFEVGGFIEFWPPMGPIFTDWDYPFPYTAGNALALNEAQQVVGWRNDIDYSLDFGGALGFVPPPIIIGSYEPIASLWQDGVWYNLNALLDGQPSADLFLSAAVDINESGAILAHGMLSGEEHSFLLNPVENGFHPTPEPQSLLLGLAGGITVGAWTAVRRRRNLGKK